MKFQVNEAEYLGLLKIKSVVEAALRSRDHCTTEAGYRRMFELIRAEVEAYYTATGQQTPDFKFVRFLSTKEQEKTDGKD